MSQSFSAEQVPAFTNYTLVTQRQAKLTLGNKPNKMKIVPRIHTCLALREIIPICPNLPVRVHGQGRCAPCAERACSLGARRALYA